MQVLFYTHYFPPETNAPASRTYDHAVRWAAKGHDVTVVTGIPNCPTGIPFPGYRSTFRSQSETIDGVRVVRLWTYLAANAGTVRRIANYLSFLLSAVLQTPFLKRPNVVVATSPQFFCGWAGVFASWWHSVPFVLEIRDIWPESIEAVGALKAGLVTRLLARLEIALYRSADHIVCVGEGYRANVARKLGSDRKTSVITNGVDIQRFAPRDRDQQWLEALDTPARFFCTYVGTLGMAHGLEVVLHAAARLKAMGRADIAFILVGEGADAARLRGLARQLEVQSLVRFTGLVPKESAITALASTDVCLVHLRRTALFETVLPSKLFEAMAMEVPVLMGVMGEARDIVVNAKAGIAIEPENAEQLANALVRLADDQAELLSLKQSARALVVAQYNRDALALDFLQLLERVAPSHATAAGEQPGNLPNTSP